MLPWYKSHHHCLDGHLTSYIALLIRLVTVYEKLIRTGNIGDGSLLIDSRCDYTLNLWHESFYKYASSIFDMWPYYMNVLDKYVVVKTVWIFTLPSLKYPVDSTVDPVRTAALSKRILGETGASMVTSPLLNSCNTPHFTCSPTIFFAA